jgi:hypothetical protein
MKDPKEKAAELVDKMMWEGEGHEEKCFKDFAIQCAIFGVNENINSTFSKNWYNKKRIIPADYLTTDYWIEVKNELLKLQKS